MTDEKPLSDGSEEATFVEAGGFRVDRRKAIEKLSEYQLEDPHAYLLPWVRAAVAAGAKTVRFRTSEEGLELSFDGAPFSRRDLEDPYGPLFQKETAAGQARRQLTIGLLACLRTSPESIEVLSGVGKERTLLSVLTAESDRIEHAPGEDADTVVRVRRSGAFYRELDHVRNACALCPAEVLIEQEKAAPASMEGREPCLEVKDGSLRGFLGVPESLGEGSLVDAYVLGVRVQTVEMDLGAIPMRGWIDDDSLLLNVSQSAVLQDARYRALAGKLARRAVESVALVSRELEKRLPQAAGRLRQDKGLRDAWAEGMRASSSSRAGGLGGAFFFQLKGLWHGDHGSADGPQNPLAWEIRALKWMRALCGSMLSDPNADPQSELGKVLWAAPLCLNCKGEALDLTRLDRIAGPRGRIPYSYAPTPSGTPPDETIWAFTDEDIRFLLSRYTPEDAT